MTEFYVGTAAIGCPPREARLNCIWSTGLKQNR